MRFVLFPFLGSLAASLMLVPFARAIAVKAGAVAQPKQDRWHQRPTALFGGVAIALSVLGTAVVFDGFRGQPALLACAALMFVFGLADDLLGVKPATKLIAQIALASVFLFFHYRLGWSHSLTLDSVLTIVWVVGIINAFNLLDNMDGLCAGLCVIAGSGVLAALWLSGATGPEVTHLALLIGAAAGFLIYNFSPASIFMGDSGSLFLGLNLAVLTLASPADSQAPSSLLTFMAAPALILMLPILDTTLVTVSRLRAGRSPAQGGRDHSSHRLVAIGLSERGAVLALWSLAALGGLLGVALQHYRGDLPSLAAAVFVLASIIFAVYLSHVRVYEENDAALERSARITPFVVNFIYRRRIAELFLDLCLTAIAYYSAYRLRFDGAVEFRQYFPQFLQSLPLVIGVQLVSLFLAGGYRGIWRYFGLMDGVTFAKGVGIGTLLNIAILTFAYRFEAYSRGVFIIYAALLLLLLAGSRASFRLISEFAHRRNQRGPRVAIYGAGDVGASVVRDILTRREGAYRMLGFIVDEPSMARAQMQGSRVLGTYEELLRLVDSGGVDLVVMTELVDVERLEALRLRCVERGVSLERLHCSLDQLVATS